MNNLDKKYKELLIDILDNGRSKGDRTGTGNISVFGRTIRHDMKDGFPLLTSKKMAWKQILSELLWFLRGDTNIKYLLEHKNYIWVGDAYKKYLESHKYSSNPISFKDRIPGNGPVSRDEFIRLCLEDDWFSSSHGNLGPVYGKQWVNWGGGIKPTIKNVSGINQIEQALDQLKNNPLSRRIMVNAWNVSDLPSMTLPPCHYSFQLYTVELTLEERYRIWFNRNYETGMEYYEKNAGSVNFDDPYYDPTPKYGLSLLFNMRSVDVPLGLPFNIASYGLLLSIFAKKANMMPQELIGNLGDTHIYNNQIEGVKDQIVAKTYNLSRMSLDDKIIECPFDELDVDMFDLIGYQSSPTIKFPLSN